MFDNYLAFNVHRFQIVVFQFDLSLILESCNWEEKSINKSSGIEGWKSNSGSWDESSAEILQVRVTEVPCK